MTQYTHLDLPGIYGPGVPFALGEGDDAIKYAGGWWVKTTPQKIASLGFVAYVEPEPEPELPSTDPSDYPLLPWQFKALVDYLGKDDEIRGAIGTIQDPMKRAASMSRYQNASVYHFGDPLLQAMRAAIGMSEQDLASAWLLAKDLSST